MRGHFGTTAERRWNSVQACNRETTFKDTQGHRYYIMLRFAVNLPHLHLAHVYCGYQ